MYDSGLSELYRAFSTIRNEDEFIAFLDDLLTPREREEMVHRMRIFHLLDAGGTQRDIAEGLGVSVTTVTRGSRMLHHGTGMIRTVLDRLRATTQP